MSLINIIRKKNAPIVPSEDKSIIINKNILPPINKKNTDIDQIKLFEVNMNREHKYESIIPWKYMGLESGEINIKTNKIFCIDENGEKHTYNQYIKMN